MTCFARRSSITSFGGADPGAVQSGSHEVKSVPTSKSGSPELRRALFLVMDCLLKSMLQDDSVYRFMDKKRAEGTPYLVYMTASTNKFLCIYYGRVREHLAKPEKAAEPTPNELSELFCSQFTSAFSRFPLDFSFADSFWYFL